MAVPPRAFSCRPTGSDRQDALASHSPAGTLRRKISKPASLAADAQPAISPIFMTAIARAQAQAQAFLRSAIATERAKRWPEVFETYYHLGVALQNIGNHHEALEEFTLALETAYIPKNVCQVGCASGSFYQIPVLGRRAYSYVKCDRIKDAIRDSTRAVHLDPSNPDVYCIRALVWSSSKEKRRALIDLNVSFKLNSSHVCTLILRGAILSSLGSLSSQHNKDHEKAFALSWDSKNFSDVEDFYNPKISSFYDKFLWSLNAFHTITEINLFDGATFAANSNITRDMGESKARGPFKCGSLAIYSDNKSLERRKAYTEIVRQSAIGINVKKDSSSSVTPVKKDLSSSLTWGFENEELMNCEENEAKKFLKKASNSIDWVL